ncbi:MAG: lipopolysaccharide assembly protein LapB [Legionellales bacterium]|nr:lipopolysaccharide assembly protein LapB [Legionellales bacterium]HAG61727.1 lipopolysaccharide assembly protein LapB [Coxiellaceae bacterium]
MTVFAYVFFPLVALGAWLFGRRSNLRERLGFPVRFQRDYFRGLNFLINEQPDKAVDVFIKLMEIDSDTVETHLALAGLFRRRGEVDRAIKIHQNLIARPQLEQHHRHQALLALGEDYLSAGVLDRAEKIFLELSEQDKHDGQSLLLLLQIYHLEKEWNKAIKIAQRLAVFSGTSYRLHIAHYYCELSEDMRRKQHFQEAKHYLHKAQSIDRHCVRAYLLEAKSAFHAQDYTVSIRAYERVMEEDPNYVTEILDDMAICYEHCGHQEAFTQYLQGIYSATPFVDVAACLSKLLYQQHGLQTAIDFLENYVAKHGSLWALAPLIQCYADSASVPDAQKLLKLERHLESLLLDHPTYRCLQCGFSGTTLHWLCPSCQTWSSTKPIRSTDVLSRKPVL